MTETMVERVARAMVKRAGETFGENETFDGMDDNGRAFAIVMAMAAIAAMREPPEAIVKQGIKVSHGGTLCSWQVMIDAALNESAGT